MLIALWMGRKPTLRTYEMLCWYFMGMADEEELGLTSLVFKNKTNLRGWLLFQPSPRLMLRSKI